MNTLHAIISSTFGRGHQIDLRRTSHYFSKDAVTEVCRQINQRHYEGKDIPYFLHKPFKKKEDQPLIQTSLMQKPQQNKANAVIGFWRTAEVFENEELGNFQCKAMIEFISSEIRDNVAKNKAQVCPIVIIKYEDSSLKKEISLDGGNSELYQIFPPFQVLTSHVGLRQHLTTNPYLRFI